MIEAALTKQEILKKCAVARHRLTVIIGFLCVSFVMTGLVVMKKAGNHLQGYLYGIAIHVFLIDLAARLMNMKAQKEIGIVCKKCGFRFNLFNCQKSIETNTCLKCGMPLFDNEASDVIH